LVTGYITKDPAHWTRSTTLLDAWGTTLTDIIGTDRSLLIGIEGTLLVNAAEIMRWEQHPALLAISPAEHYHRAGKLRNRVNKGPA
jgi:hypothetical protein